MNKAQRQIDTIDLQRRALLDMFHHKEVKLTNIKNDDGTLRPYLKSEPGHRNPPTDEVKQYVRQRCGMKAKKVWWQGGERNGMEEKKDK